MVLSAVFMWGASFSLLKIGLDYLPPIGFAAIRYGIAAIKMVVVIIYRSTFSGMLKEFRSDWKLFFMLGVVGIALPNALLNLGLQHTTASLSSIIQASGPVYTIIFAVILLREGLGVDKVVGSVIAITGTVLLLVQDGVDLNDVTFTGNLLVLLSAMSYAISGVVTKMALKRHHPINVTGWSLIIGSLLLCLVTPLEVGGVYTLNSEVWVIILVLALFPGCLAFLFYNYVLRTKEVSSLAFFIYLVPMFAIVIAHLSLGEIVSLDMVLLAGMVIAGLAVAQYKLISRWRNDGED